jgi:hypothetical protein
MEQKGEKRELASVVKEVNVISEVWSRGVSKVHICSSSVTYTVSVC